MYQYKGSTSEKGKMEYWVYPVILIFSLLFLLVHAKSTSPLYIGSESDSYVFMLMGRYFVLGKMPYVDFFDHKGPIIIFIEAIGQLLCSDQRMGLFIIEVVVLFISLSIIYVCSRLVLKPFQSISVVFLILLYYSTTLHGGNKVEEYSLPFLLLPLYFTLKFLSNKNTPIAHWNLFLIGVCFGIVFWIRPNNCACICAFISFFLIENLRLKVGNIYSFLSLLFCGFVFVSAPIVFYFWYKGALNEMVYAAYTFNFKYAFDNNVEAQVVDFIIHLRAYFINYFPFVLLLISGAMIYYKDKNHKSYLLLIFLLIFWGIIATQIGITASYYMTIMIPAIVVALIFIIDSLPNKLFTQPIYMGFISILVVLLIGGAFFKTQKYNNLNAEHTEYFTESNSIIECIPKTEMNDVFTYEVSPMFIYHANILPYHPNFIYQNSHGYVDRGIFSSINSMMVKEPPKWLVLEIKKTNSNNHNHNPQFYKIVSQKYFLLKKNHNFELYKLNEAL